VLTRLTVVALAFGWALLTPANAGARRDCLREGRSVSRAANQPASAYTLPAVDISSVNWDNVGVTPDTSVQSTNRAKVGRADAARIAKDNASGGDVTTLVHGRTRPTGQAAGSFGLGSLPFSENPCLRARARRRTRPSSS
jgi:hypothetical protein